MTWCQNESTSWPLRNLATLTIRIKRDRRMSRNTEVKVEVSVLQPERSATVSTPAK